jgi:cytochrome P450
VPHYALHRNPAYFPAPRAFRPARWLPAAAAAAAAKYPADGVDDGALVRAREAFAPFSVGPRGCVGKGLAYVELSVTLARLLVAFDLRVAPGTHVGEAQGDLEGGSGSAAEYQLKDTFTSVKDGPVLQFRRREDAGPQASG